MQSPQVTGHRSGVLLVLAAVVLWSGGGLGMKSPAIVAIPLEERGPVLACFRVLFAAFCLLPFVRWRRMRWSWGLAPLLLSFAAMNVTYVSAVTRTTAAAAIFLQCTSTFWVFAFSTLILRERSDRAGIAGLVLALLGISLIVAESWRGEFFLGNLLGLASGVAYAGVVLSLRGLRSEDAAGLVFLAHACSGLLFLPGAAGMASSLMPIQWGWIAALGCLQMALPYFLFARGIRQVTAQDAVLIGLLEPLLNPLLVWLFWGEVVDRATILGGCLILAGLLVRVVYREPAPSQVADAA